MCVGNRCETALFSTKFQFLDHLFEDLDRFGNLRVLNASFLAFFEVGLRIAYMRTAIRRASRMQKASCALQSILKDLQGKERDTVSRIKPHVQRR